MSVLISKEDRAFIRLIIVWLVLFAFLFENGNAQCSCANTLTNSTTSSYTFSANSTTCVTGTPSLTGDIIFGENASICVESGATLTIGANNYSFPSSTVNIDVYGTLKIDQNPTWAGKLNLYIHSTGTFTSSNTITLNGSVMDITNDGSFTVGTLQFQQSGATITITNNAAMHITQTLNISQGNAYFKNTGTLTVDGEYSGNSLARYVNCGTYIGKFNLNGGKLINTGTFNTSQIEFGSSTSMIENYGHFYANGSINNSGPVYNEGVFTFNSGYFQGSGNLTGPTDTSKKGYFVWSGKNSMNGGVIGPNLNFRNSGGTSSVSEMFNNYASSQYTWKEGLTWGETNPGSLPSADCPAANGAPVVPTPSETAVCVGVNLTFIQPSYSNVTYEWWTGTSTSRTAQITTSTSPSLTDYTTPETVYLWAKDNYTGTYSDFGAAVSVNACADLSVTKVADKNKPAVGETVTFTITASNAGPSNATGVNVTDTLPSGFSFSSASTANGSYDKNTGIWTIENLAKNQSATLTITATVK
jgi:uncharacterized repeat protein (TIGR01451 family)